MNIGQRIKLIQSFLFKNALDAFLVMTKINRQYVSGFTGSAGVVLITTPSYIPPLVRGRKSGGVFLFVDERYLIRARRESALPVKNLRDLAKYLTKIKKIGIEDRITLRELTDLKKRLSGVRFVVTKNIVENLRAVKTAQEIGYIKQAQKIVDQTFWHIKKSLQNILIQPPSPGVPALLRGRGRAEERSQTRKSNLSSNFSPRQERRDITEAAIALEIERYAKKLGADGLAFDSIIAFGPNAAAPHHLSGKQKIRKNNFLLMDFGVLVKGYNSDFTRTLFLGRPDKKQERVYNTVLEAQKQGIAKVRVGNVANTVDAAARAHIQKQKFGKYFTHNTGHGVGLEIHELPNFSPVAEDKLKPGMIVTVEPGIYIEKWGGVRIEDMVEVTTKGPVLMTKVPRDLKSMIIK